MSLFSTQFVKRGAAYLLVAMPLVSHAQFVVVSQNASVSSTAPFRSDNKSSDTLDSVSLLSTSTYTVPPTCSNYGVCGAPGPTTTGMGRYSSTITPDALTFEAGAASSPDGTGGATGVIMLDVLADTQATYEAVAYRGSGVSFRRDVMLPDGGYGFEALLPQRTGDFYSTNGSVSLVAGSYRIYIDSTMNSSTRFSLNAVTSVPEPAALGLMSLGLVGMALAARRSKRLIA